VLLERLTRTVRAKDLAPFYSVESLHHVVARLEKVDWKGIAAAERILDDIALDLSGLALYDTVLFVDDSGG